MQKFRELFFYRSGAIFFIMPRGSKSKYTDKQKRQAEHIEESYEKRGKSRKVAAQRAWQTVNKQTGGGEKSGGGRKATSSGKKAARKESGRRAAASRKQGSRKTQSHPTRHKASASAK
jgi:plasmid stabilization system protein ParE